MARQHDADLCDRIRALEKRVAELEAQQANHQSHGHWYGGWWQVPTTIYPQFVNNTSGTTGFVITTGD